MRGKATTAGHSQMDSGITPAYAGKSADRSPSFQNRRDHPRLCGEKLEPYRRTAEKLGITPAYAGKSAHRNLFFRSSQDHPRLCGEKAGIPVQELLL